MRTSPSHFTTILFLLSTWQTFAQTTDVLQLRHSFPPHLPEAGTDIRYIQEVLGHNNPKTTMIYTHVSSKKLSEIRSPLEDLDI